MFDIGSTELLLIAIVAIVVIGPRDLPRALYKLGQIVGKARGMARHFRTGIDAMVREAELEELEKKWAAENERIMKEFPTVDGTEDVAMALAAPAKEPATDSEPETVAPTAPADAQSAAAAKGGPAA